MTSGRLGIGIRRTELMNRRERRFTFLGAMVLGLLAFVGPPARAEPGSVPRDGQIPPEKSGAVESDRSFPWMAPLGAAWRQEYVRTYLPGNLFRQDVSFCPYGGGQGESQDAPNPSTVVPAPAGEEKVNCGGLCSSGEQYLAAGFLPEALADYKTAAEKGCSFEVNGCHPEVGMLKADLAMGRFSEARRRLQLLSDRPEIEQKRLLILIAGILAALDQDLDRALERFTEAGTDWHLCPNLEPIVGYALFQKHRYEDARNVFRVAMHSPWTSTEQFGVLGLADCHVALGQWDEAEPLYESLARTGSPLGLLGLAEFRLRQGKVKEATTEFTELAASVDQDYWKGVALAYMISLRSQPDEWAEALLVAQKAQALVISKDWAERLRERTVQALDRGVRALRDKGSDGELLILSAKWKDYQPDLAPSTQLLVGRAHEDSGLYASALEIYGRLSSEPDALFRRARLAWKCGRQEEARASLEAYLASDSKTNRDDAKLLLACVHARRNRLDLARESLRGMGPIRDSSLLVDLGSVEASLGMFDVAIEHLRAALEQATLSDAERRHILFSLGELNYKRGSFEEALAFFQSARDGEGAGEGSAAGPMEVLCLARLQKPESARGELENMAAGQEKDLVTEVLDAEDLSRLLRGKGYAF